MRAIEEFTIQLIKKLYELDELIYVATCEQGLFSITVSPIVMQTLIQHQLMRKLYEPPENSAYPDSFQLHLTSGPVDFKVRKKENAIIACRYCKSFSFNEDGTCLSCGAKW